VSNKCRISPTTAPGAAESCLPRCLGDGEAKVVAEAVECRRLNVGSRWTLYEGGL